MSIVLFPGVGTSDSVDVVDDSGSEYTGYFVKCSAKITVPLASNSGGRRSQICQWDSCGATLAQAVNNASDVAQWIVDNSNGYITTFSMNVGLYRPDAEGTPVESGSLKYWSFRGTNGKTNAGVVRTGLEKVVSPNIYVPFAKTNKSYDTLLAEFQALVTAGKLCQINFADADKSKLRCSVLTGNLGGAMKAYDAKTIAQLTSIDTSAGGGDGVLAKRS